MVCSVSKAIAICILGIVHFVGSAGIGVADGWSDLLLDVAENFGKDFGGDKIEAFARKHGAGDFGSALARSIGETGVERLRQAVSVASDDQETNALRGRLIDGVDAETTFGEFFERVRRIEARLRQIADRERELTYQLQYLQTDVARNRELINHVQSELNRHEERFQAALRSIDADIVRLNAGLIAIETELKNEIQAREMKGRVQDRRISRLESLISPRTSKQTSALLGATAANILIDNGDPKEAAKILQLAIAYDRRENRFADPGLRYYLAVAYRRMGKEVAADEMLMEGIVCQRFRTLPDWYRYRTEFFQGPDRKWLRDAQYDPRFGVAAPRNVAVTDEAKIPYQIPLRSPRE